MRVGSAVAHWMRRRPPGRGHHEALPWTRGQESARHREGIRVSGAHTRAGARHRARLRWVLVLVVVFMAVEAAAGFLAGSLALLSDAGHMATDALGLGMALAAVVTADRAGSGIHRTFGLYRLEILAALANAVLLAGVGGYVIVEAIRRVAEPRQVAAVPMLVVASVGLAVNVAGWWLLREGASESLNIEGAVTEVLADLWGSVGAIAAAVVILTTGWAEADAVFGGIVGLFILPRAYRLGRRAVRVLVQAAPEHVDVDAVRRELLAIEGVGDVHDLHIWTLTSDMDVASVHLMTPADLDAHPILDTARALLIERYGIAHATLQVEPDTHTGCQEVSW